MTAFHSDDAFDRLKTMPKVRGKEAVEPNAATKNFRAFRKELVRGKKRGWSRVWREGAGWVGGREREETALLS